MNCESLIFDIDGTLWDSRQLVAEGYNIQLEKEGLSHLFVTAEQMQPLFGKVMTEIADVLFASIDPSQRYDLMERCMKTENDYLFANECKIGYPKVKETLAELSKHYRLFIVSNSQCGYPELCIDKLDLGDYIEGHMCFGDTQGDLEACREAGIPFIFCGYGLGQAESYDARIESIEELLEM